MGKYEEALERAKQGLPIDEVFPELKESEDERIRTRLIALVEAFGQGLYKNEMLAYLERYKEQKSAEWSEEDKHCIHQLILFCENCMQQDSEAIRCANWLKSLRPKPHWKPSAPQMRALREAVNEWDGFAGQSTLESLYNDLKKL